MFRRDKTKIPVFGRIWSEFQRWEGLGQNSHIWKDKDRTPMIGRIRSEVQRLKG